METIGKWALEQAQSHPVAVAWFGVVVAVAVLLTNGLRFAYPEYKDMPRLARFVCGMLDPLAGNFWNLARRIDPDFAGQHTMRDEPGASAKP